MANYWTTTESPGQPFTLTDYDSSIVDWSSGRTAAVWVVSAADNTLVRVQTESVDLSTDGYTIIRQLWHADTLTAIIADLARLGKTKGTYQEIPVGTRASDSATEAIGLGNPVTHTFAIPPAVAA